MPSTPMPEGFHTLTAHLAVRDAARALVFYQAAFGATETLRLTGPSGTIAHAEMRIGDSMFMLAEELPGFNHSPQEFGGSTVHLALYVDDVDAVVSRAVAAGAKLVIPVKDQFYGARSGRIEDPFGHIWIISTHTQDMSTQEMQRRFEAFLKSHQS